MTVRTERGSRFSYIMSQVMPKKPVYIMIFFMIKSDFFFSLQVFIQVWLKWRGLENRKESEALNINVENR